MRYLLSSLIALTTTIGITGCSEPPPIPEPDSRPAKLFTVTLGNSNFERQFPATSEAGDKAVLAFRVPGQLQSIEVLEGQKVRKGDVLAKLNPDEYELLAKQARAQFALADVQFLRAQKLRQDQVVSEQEFDQAQANHNSAKAVLEQAKANLSYTQLIAPYDGTISLVTADNFEYMAAKQSVMNIQTDQLMKVVLQLPDHLLVYFAKGNVATAAMTFDAFPEHKFPLTFQEVDTEADAKTGTYKVTMVMDRPTDTGILPGMSGVVHITAGTDEATTIPKSAILEQDGISYVWRVNQAGVVEKAKVTLDEQRHVISGLSNGEQIITSGVNSMTPGIKVREWIKERGL